MRGFRGGFVGEAMRMGMGRRFSAGELQTILLALLEELGQPLIGTTLQLPGDEHMLSDPEEVRERIGKQLDLVIDGGAGTLEATTVIDLTGPEPALLRQGRGDPAAFGL